MFTVDAMIMHVTITIVKKKVSILLFDCWQEIMRNIALVSALWHIQNLSCMILIKLKRHCTVLPMRLTRSTIEILSF